MASWTTPHSYTVGEVLTAATLNTNVRDNETYLYDRLSVIGGTPSVPVTMTSAGTTYTGASLSVPAGTWLIVGCIALTATGGDNVTLDLRNTTDSTTLVSEVMRNSGTKYTNTLIVGAVFAGTKTVTARAKNGTTGGGSLTVANLVAIRTAP